MAARKRRLLERDKAAVPQAAFLVYVIAGVDETDHCLPACVPGRAMIRTWRNSRCPALFRRPVHESLPAFHCRPPPAGLAVAPPAYRHHRACADRLRQALGVALLAAGVAHAPAQALDLNDATAQQLAGIRGIGPRTAQTIVSERERAGRFESLEDLAERVRGISQKRPRPSGRPA
ncbi:DUF655 domain-containing protein [Achromobacter xylosoxidans]